MKPAWVGLQVGRKAHIPVILGSSQATGESSVLYLLGGDKDVD